MRDFDFGYELVQQHDQITVTEYRRQARQQEVFIWIDWVITVGALLALSAISYALNWPLVITCILVLLTSLYGFFLALMVRLLFDRNAFK